MILDSMKNCAAYYALSPRIEKAFKLFAEVDWEKAENGKMELDGKEIFANVQARGLKTKEEAKLEVHDKYIDIQIPLSKGETFGVKPRSECTQPDGEMNTEKDILFYHDPIEETISAEIGDIITFAPEMAHAPLIGEGTIHKAIFKVKVV